MSRSLQLAEYDKITERLAVSYSLSETMSTAARKLALVAQEDDNEGIYPLNESAAVALGVQMETRLNTNLYDWYLEPSA